MEAQTNSRIEPQKVTRRMFLLAIWVSFAAWIANFDGGYGGIVLVMPSYQKAFGHCQQTIDPETGTAIETCALTALQQSLVGISVLFMGLGSISAGVLGPKIGRRGTIQVSCLFCIAGAGGMLGTSGSFLNYMVCKSISAIGIGQLGAASIVYGTECVIASKRGLLLGIYNIGLGMGNLVSSAVCAASATLPAQDDWQWKVPIICQIPLGLILGVGMMFFPESPRWLLVRGKEEEARRSFSTLQNVMPYSDTVTAQVRDIQQSLEYDRATNASTSWTEIYRGHNLQRTAISAFILVGLAITGIHFVSPYATLFLEVIGIENPYLINAIVGLCIFGGACMSPFVLDSGGRRFAMLLGYSLMASCMLILSSVSTALGDSTNAKNIIVAFLCIWAFVFGGLIGSSVWLASAEMHSTRLRTIGQANTTFFYQIFAFGAQFWTPYMLNAEHGNMGVNVGYFYFGVTVAVLGLVYLFVPETARLTLEQIDDFFLSDGKARNTSTKKNVAISRVNPRRRSIPLSLKGGIEVENIENAPANSNSDSKYAA
jgi:sugar porter (SP) family MFS transporter